MSDKTADMLAEDCQSNYACQFHHSGFCGYCSAKLKKAAQKINRQGIEIADHKKWDDLQAQQIEDLTREVARLREIIIDIGRETVVCADAYKKMGLPFGNDFEIEINKLKENVKAASSGASGGEVEEI